MQQSMTLLLMMMMMEAIRTIVMMSTMITLLQSLLRMMQELATVWLICVLAGTSCAVFYTKSTDNDYPRIGRRSFFTGGGTSSFYPRVGRSRLLIATSGNTNDDITSGGQAYDGDFLSLINKRGIFTSGDQGFPRVGRAGSDASGSAIGNAVGEKSPASLAASAEAADLQVSDDQDQFRAPLGFMFFDFDKNGKIQTFEQSFLKI